MEETDDNAVTAATANSDEKHKERWVNLNAWVASLVASLHTGHQKEPDYSLFCIWTVRTALEQEGEVTNIAIKAAAVWFMYGAAAIWDLTTRQKSFDGEVAKPGSVEKGKSWTGFSEERWTAWVRRFARLQNSISDKMTAELVGKALQAMKSAED